MVLTSQSPLTDLKRVGPALAKKLASLGLTRVADLVDYYPRTYQDYSMVTSIARLRPGPVTVRARIVDITGRYARRGIHVTEAVASDDSGSVRLVWFRQPYRVTGMDRSRSYYISGNLELRHQRLVIMNPSAELVSDFPLNTARIVPVYRETRGLSSRQIRSLLSQVLPYMEALPETLPDWLLESERLMSRAEAMRTIHFPPTSEALAAANRRLGFEEVLSLSLAALLNKQDMAGVAAPAVPFRQDVARRFVDHLPFRLTDAQRRVIWQIYLDMQRPQPMNRLVEGDVGSGKTVVAAMAAVMVMHHGHQVAFMAPTEILARQHADTLLSLLRPLGYGDSVGLLVGSMSAQQKDRVRHAVAAGDIRLIVGTQALIQDKVDMRSLELAIIDEQHRFGVQQRQALQAKAGHMPHMLSLTATPIPRSLALTLYGELDISIVDDKPAGRLPVITRIASPNSRSQLYAELARELAAGRQMFVVCPLIADSDTPTVRSVEQTYDEMCRAFPNKRVGLLHGQLKPAAKNTVMSDFVAGHLDILVSTTVIEVGVDVPNASLMLVEGAERFGLSQIHQLRGRVGRGNHQGYCYLMLSDSRPPSPRLRALESSDDGFRLAELDLELRGPGAIYGTLQHGQLDLRVAKLSDSRLIAAARRQARNFLERPGSLLQYPELAARVERLRAVTSLN